MLVCLDWLLQYGITVIEGESRWNCLFIHIHGLRYLTLLQEGLVEQGVETVRIQGLIAAMTSTRATVVVREQLLHPWMSVDVALWLLFLLLWYYDVQIAKDVALESGVEAKAMCHGAFVLVGSSFRRRVVRFLLLEIDLHFLAARIVFVECIRPVVARSGPQVANMHEEHDVQFVCEAAL